MTGKLTKSTAKFIKSLQQKKYRDSHNRFVVEGFKMVEEALNLPGIVDFVVYTGDIQEYNFNLGKISFSTSPKELRMISSLQNPNKILAVCHKITPLGKWDYKKPILALEGISDTGNFGTLIRLAEWFGLSQIVCSPGSVDLYNPKVVQASMGSIFRMNCFLHDLSDLITSAPPQVVACRADMDGDNLYQTAVPSPYILVMGSESHGVSDSLRSLIPKAVSIPRFGGGESLNVAVSAGIILSEFNRNRTR